MADLTAVVVSAPRLASSTDTVVCKVSSRSGADLSAKTFQMAISESSATPAANWLTAANAAGVVSLLVGPDSATGELDQGTKWVHLTDSDAVILAGPFVVSGGEAAVVPPDDEDYDGGEVT